MSDNTSLQITKELMELSFQIRTLTKDIERFSDELERAKVSLYDPDNGIYKRISDLKDQLSEQQKVLKVLEQKMQNRHESYEEKLLELEATSEKLVEISDGPALPTLRLTVDKFKKTDKLIWVLSTAALTGFVKILYDILSGLF